MKKKRKEEKWILCNKWFIPKMKPVVLTEEEKKADTPPNKKPEYDYIPRWTPIGIRAGVPMWWGSEKEVVDIAKALVEENPDLARLLFVACKVKYVPGKVKHYKESWKNKYVLKESPLKITKRKDFGEAKFTDDTRINID